MSNDKNLKKIADLLKTTEELKTIVAPLLESHLLAKQVIDRHTESIEKLMEDMLGNEKEHKEMMESIELVKTRITNLEVRHDHLLVQESESIKAVLMRDRDKLKELYAKTTDCKDVSERDLEVIEKIISRYKTNAELRGLKADILDCLGRTPEALKYLDSSIHELSDTGWLWYSKAVLLESSSHNDKMYAYNEALQLIPEEQKIQRHSVFLNMAFYLLQIGKEKDALTAIERSIDYSFDCSFAWDLKAHILYRLDRYTEALGCAEKATELDKDNADAWVVKGLALASLGPAHYGEALESMKEASKLVPDSPEMLANIGTLYWKMDKLEEALKHFDMALERDPNDPCVWCKRGACLNNMRNAEEALSSFEKALSLDSSKRLKVNCPVVFLDCAIALRNLGRLDESKKMLEKAIGLGLTSNGVKQLLKTVNAEIRKSRRTMKPS